MRYLLIATLSLLFGALASSDAMAGRLTIAVLQFPEVKDRQQLETALAGLQLADLCNADRLETKNPYLSKGAVLFAQSFGCSAGQPFSISTRMGSNRIDTTGSLQSGQMSVEVIFANTATLGIPNSKRGGYSGASAFRGSTPAVLSLDTRKVKERLVIKNDVKPPTSVERTTVLVGQFVP